MKRKRRRRISQSVLQHMIDEWLKYESIGWHKMATQCFIAAVNYYKATQ